MQLARRVPGRFLSSPTRTEREVEWSSSGSSPPGRPTDMSDEHTKKDRERIIAEDMARLNAMSDDDIDYSDIPPIRDWSGAVRGRHYVPVTRQVTLDIDPGVVAWYRRDGRGPDAGINAALLDYVLRQRRAS